MALAPLLMFLGGAATRPKGLFVGGNDVVMSVDPETIEVEEQGPGGVSSMSFTIDDPSKLVTLAAGQEVFYRDNTNDFTIFRGWVSHWDVYPDFGDQGRHYTVACDGLEIQLDWAKVIGSFTFVAGSQASVAVQTLVAACAAGPIRDFVSSAVQSTQAQPVCSNGQLGIDVTTGNKSLRECLRDVLNVAYLGISGVVTALTFTLDFDWGLRTWAYPAVAELPIDWSNVNLSLNFAGATKPENVNGSVDTSPVVRACYVVGGNAAGTGWVTDGTGLPGETVILGTDATILTDAAKQTAGQAYLTQFGVTVRGQVSSIDHAPFLNVHAGGAFTLATSGGLTNVSINDGQPRIGTIRKQYLHSGRETWTITYGGLAPKATSLMRRLTRTTVN